jgi:hypothetical protein
LKKLKNVNVSAFEIYNNKLYDLICTKENNTLEMHEKQGNIYISDLTILNCTIDDISKFIRTIMKNRKSGKSFANNVSSRSHVVVKIQSTMSNIIFVDVAGCEKYTNTKLSQNVQNELININKDNFALKECMRNMLFHKNNNHIPFRLSKITMVLKDAFYDAYDTVVITTVNPKKSHIGTTLNILSYVNDLKKYSKIKKQDIENTSNNKIIKKNKLEKKIMELYNNEIEIYTKHIEKHNKIFYKKYENHLNDIKMLQLIFLEQFK